VAHAVAERHREHAEEEAKNPGRRSTL